MKKNSKTTYILSAISLSPFLIGGLMNALLTATPAMFLTGPLILFLFLIGWAIIAYVLEPQIKSVLKIVLIQNAVPAIVLILVGIGFAAEKTFQQLIDTT